MIDEKIEKSNILNEDILKLDDIEIGDLADTAESLVSTDSNQFDQTLEAMSKTLASIDTKMDFENEQLQKLDQLSEIKNQLNRLEGISSTNAEEVNHESTVEDVYKAEGSIPQNNIGHNQQEISELLEKIDSLEKKVLTIENQSHYLSKKFEKAEIAVKRFEDLEDELPNLFKNLFKKKEKKDYKENEITPEDKTLILEDKTNETLINNDFNKDFTTEDKITKSYFLKYVFWIFLLLCSSIVALFLFDKFQIIDLTSNEIISSIFYFIDSTYEKFLYLFY